MSEKPTTEKIWHVQDCGDVDINNAVWTYCENIEARDNMAPGTTCYLDFKTGAGRDTVKVKRLA